MRLLLAALLVTLAVAGEVLRPEATYQVVDGDKVTVLAPGVAWAAQDALAVVGAPTLEACAAACRSMTGQGEGQTECTEFEHCQVEEGCTRVEPHLRYLDCRLLASNCTLLPAVDAGPTWVRRISGFPLRQQPLQLRDYTTRPAEVLEGGDFDCPGSVLPDRCAFSDVLDAIYICSGMASCRSVVHYHNGTDGCSNPVAVLSTRWPTGNNSYVAPTVDVLTKNSDRTVSMLLMASEGTVLPPSAAELAAAANASDPSTAWMGCIVAEGALMGGTLVALESGVATAEECCRACRADSKCNVWNHCGQAGGCSYAGSSPIGSFQVNLTRGQCELRRQDLVEPNIGWPPIVLAKGSDVSLTAGAPMALTGPQLPGYDMLLGKVPFDYGSYDCPESKMPNMHVCVLYETPEQMAQDCDAFSECVAFMIKPMPGPPSSLRIAVPKNAVNTSLLGLSPTDLFYVQQSAQGSSGGLSGGAIAGIAVGACVAAAALAGAAWLGLRRRQRQRQQQQSPSAGAGDGDKEKGPTASSLSGGLGDGSAQTSSALPAMSHAQSGSSALVQPCQAAARGAADGRVSAGHGSPPGSPPACSPHADSPPGSPPAGSPPGSPPGSLPPLPPMRAGWSARASPSPFAAQAAMPFASAFTSGAATPLPAGTTSGTATPGTNRSRHHGSGSRSHSVQAIPAVEAEAAAAAAMGAASASAGAAGSSSHASSEETLPELVRHVAECDAAQTIDLGDASAAAGQHTLISIDALPPSLQESVVDVNQIKYLTWPNGRLQELGSGASATVYRALYLNEIVAAKEIDIGRSPAMQEAFVNEALRLHQLHHPHVVALLGVAIAGSTGILLMEYCAGRDLRSALGLTAADANERLFGWHRRGRRVILEIAKALNFLHARGVVHMDVKSNNVLLTSGGTAKLADVGLSRIQKGTYLSDVPLIGTFAWIAPEILVGSKQCTSAVDIYSLGVVMWEIITGEQPQRGSLRLPRVPEECPQEVADLMMECLRLEPSLRPTAAQVMQRLEGGRSALEAAAVGVPVRRSADGVPLNKPASQ